MALAKLKAKIPFVNKQAANYDIKEDGVKDPEKDDDASSLSSGDENEERGNWGHQAEFILACLGYAVGLGNIWRFPYLCMRNGGGAFLIPYFTCMLLCAMPLFFLELSIGQFSSLSPIQVWNFSPIFRGCGWGMVILSGICCLYYNIILTWVIYYLGMSLKSIGKSQLPWGTCDNEWNTPLCSATSRSDTSLNTSISSLNTTYDVPTEAGYAMATTVSMLANGTELQTKSPSEEFWEHHVLELSSGIFDLGGVRWQLLVCLIVAWVIVFLCMCKGVKSTGKVVYVTATLPYVFLFILLIRGATLPGAIDGVKYYIYPDFKKLLNFKVWAEACLQIFYSLGPSWGGLITMSSFNKFHNNHLRDAILIPTVTCFTSFFAGFVIFSVIGYMAYEANLPVEKVVTSGPGLAFIAYPEALNKMPLASFWAISFFTMLLTVGLDSQFAMFECLVSGFVDQFPNVLMKWKTPFTLLLSVVMCVCGTIFCSRAGMYWFQIVDWYVAVFSCMIIGFLECIACAYVYGMNRMYDDIQMMIGYRPNIWWKICWAGVTPISLLIIICYSFGKLVEPTYGDYIYPFGAIAIGWCIALSSSVPLVLFAIYELVKAKGTFLERLRKVTRPTEAWGPALAKYKAIYKHRFSPDSVNTVSSDSARYDGDEKVDLQPAPEKVAV